MNRQTAAGVFCVLAEAVNAEEPQAPDFQRSLEMPAHRAVVARMSDESVKLAPFTTDGCSGGLSWSWQMLADFFPNFEVTNGAAPPWEACCVMHDRAYHAAGGATTADESYDARRTADETLRQCVTAQGASDLAELSAQYNVPEARVRLAYSLIGDAMYNAVRLGGAPCTGLPWRWGYGYPGCRSGS
ncbi:MAG: hypothetical protein AAGF27_08165 [Pseudomonadota bacterium]